MNEKTVLLLNTILLFVNIINCKIMNKQEVLDIKINDYINDCPDYSDGFDMGKGWCSFTFYCRDNICGTIDEHGIVELPENNDITKTKRYIADVCQPENIGTPNCDYSDEYHTRSNCTMDSDCLSNKCIKSTCIINDASPVIKCMDYYHFNVLIGDSGKMVCAKPDGIKCKKNNECASRECSRKHHICISIYHNHSYDYIVSIIIYCIIIIILLILICKFCCCCCCCCCP